MNIEKVVENGKTIAVVSGKKVITDVQSALDLVMIVQYEMNTNQIALDKSAITEEFFILRTGLAGEILQKFVNYQIKCAIYGDYARYTSKPLRDFIYESNQGKDVFFADSRQAAISRLAE